MLIRSTWKNIWNGGKARIAMGPRCMYVVEIWNDRVDTYVVGEMFDNLEDACRWLRESGYAREV